ncbi:MAG: S-ribosylhomocysteine lyase [Xanthomonadales bacterium]|nr:S-ribosylhomocysteine lyase [Xanthomonadales bacterium]
MSRAPEDVASLGWNPRHIGEIDHRQLKAPSIKLRAAIPCPGGDTIYCVDLRVCRPNTDSLLELGAAHSLEHFLLEGFQQRLPGGFVSVGLMGCQTGFYLVLLNEGRRQIIEDCVERILHGILAAEHVPYANLAQCGNWVNHDPSAAKRVARKLLAERAVWREVT